MHTVASKAAQDDGNCRWEVSKDTLHFDSMSWMLKTVEGVRRVPSCNVLARNTGMNSEKGRSTVCISPSFVSKLLRVSVHHLVTVYG